MLSAIYQQISNVLGIGISNSSKDTQLVENVEKLQELQEQAANEQLRAAQLTELHVEKTNCIRRTGMYIVP